MERWLRYFFLFLAKSRLLKRLALKYGLRFGAKRFVAGATLAEAVAVIRQLNEQGMVVTVDHLGEFVRDEHEAEQSAKCCIEAIETISNEQLQAQLSLKLTSLGLDISSDIALKNLRCILDSAKTHHVFVTIDMEDYARCEQILTIFKQVKQEFNEVGTVLQAYLYRTKNDLGELRSYEAHLRLCKGAYKESPEVAFPKKSDVDQQFKQMIKDYLLSSNYTAIATHDDSIISYANEIITTQHIPIDQFEFQMLYGINQERQQELVNEGYTMRVYVPYGMDWYGYFMRRLAERPANIWFVLKNL